MCFRFKSLQNFIYGIIKARVYSRIVFRRCVAKGWDNGSYLVFSLLFSFTALSFFIQNSETSLFQQILPLKYSDITYDNHWFNEYFWSIYILIWLPLLIFFSLLNNEERERQTSHNYIIMDDTNLVNPILFIVFIVISVLIAYIIPYIKIILITIFSIPSFANNLIYQLSNIYAFDFVIFFLTTLVIITIFGGILESYSDKKAERIAAEKKALEERKIAEWQLEFKKKSDKKKRADMKLAAKEAAKQKQLEKLDPVFEEIAKVESLLRKCEYEVAMLKINSLSSDWDNSLLPKSTHASHNKMAKLRIEDVKLKCEKIWDEFGGNDERFQLAKYFLSFAHKDFLATERLISEIDSFSPTLLNSVINILESILTRASVNARVNQPIEINEHPRWRGSTISHPGNGWRHKNVKEPKSNPPSLSQKKYIVIELNKIFAVPTERIPTPRGDKTSSAELLGREIGLGPDKWDKEDDFIRRDFLVIVAFNLILDSEKDFRNELFSLFDKDWGDDVKSAISFIQKEDIETEKRLTKEKIEKEKQRLEAERLEKERQRRAAQARRLKEKQRLQTERIEKEKQRLEAERLEKEKQRLEAERLEKEKQRKAKEKQRKAKEKRRDVENVAQSKANITLLSNPQNNISNQFIEKYVDSFHHSFTCNKSFILKIWSIIEKPQGKLNYWQVYALHKVDIEIEKNFKDPLMSASERTKNMKALSKYIEDRVNECKSLLSNRTSLNKSVSIKKIEFHMHIAREISLEKEEEFPELFAAVKGGEISLSQSIHYLEIYDDNEKVENPRDVINRIMQGADMDVINVELGIHQF